MLAGPLAAGLVPALLMLHPCNGMADARQEMGLVLWCAVNTQPLISAPVCNCSNHVLQNVCSDLCAVTSVLCDYSAVAVTVPSPGVLLRLLPL